MNHTTEQEKFWAGEFGNQYLERNRGEALVRSDVALFTRILGATEGVRSVMEFGCNVGLNLQALHRIDNTLQLSAYEINPNAARMAAALGIAKVTEGTILEKIEGGPQFDLTFTKGVLIHINPDALQRVYENLHALSKRYILVSEYYNPTPVTVPYRGNDDRLFKRDFAGELIDRFGLRLVDYGFVYHRDRNFPMDDPTWFLLEKRA